MASRPKSPWLVDPKGSTSPGPGRPELARVLDGSSSFGHLDSIAASVWSQTGDWTFGMLLQVKSVQYGQLFGFGDTAANTPLWQGAMDTSSGNGDAMDVRVWPGASQQANVSSPANTFVVDQRYLVLVADVYDTGLGKIYYSINGGGVVGPDADDYLRQSWANLGHLGIGASRRNGPTHFAYLDAAVLWTGVVSADALNGGGEATIAAAYAAGGRGALSAAFASAAGKAPEHAQNHDGSAADYGPDVTWSSAPLEEIAA